MQYAYKRGIKPGFVFYRSVARNKLVGNNQSHVIIGYDHSENIAWRFAKAHVCNVGIGNNSLNLTRAYGHVIIIEQNRVSLIANAIFKGVFQTVADFPEQICILISSRGIRVLRYFHSGYAGILLLAE